MRVVRIRVELSVRSAAVAAGRTTLAQLAQLCTRARTWQSVRAAANVNIVLLVLFAPFSINFISKFSSHILLFFHFYPRSIDCYTLITTLNLIDVLSNTLISGVQTIEIPLSFILITYNLNQTCNTYSIQHMTIK